MKKTYGHYYKTMGIRPLPELPKIAKLLKRNGVVRVLDLGCGNGRNAAYLAQQGFDVYGFDITTDGVKNAKKVVGRRFAGHFRVLDMNKSLPYDDGFFDAVLAIRTMYHAKVAVLRRTISEVARITRDGGYFYWQGRAPSMHKVLVAQQDPMTSKTDPVRFKRLEPRTYLTMNGPFKGSLTHYFTENEIRLFVGKHYQIKDLKFDYETKDLWYKTRVYSVLAVKK